MPYAGLASVLSRAGALRDAFTDDSQPSLGDIEKYLSDESNRIDAILAARGLTIPADSTAALAVHDVVMHGALLKAVSAKWPGTSGPQAAQELRNDIRTAYREELGALRTGVHEAVLILESAEGSADAGAGSYWDEPGVVHGDTRVVDYEPGPAVRRGMTF